MPDCKSTVYSSGVSANVRFTGDADAINSALLRLSAGADSATGLGIEILITMMWRLPLMVNQVFVI